MSDTVDAPIRKKIKLHKYVVRANRTISIKNGEYLVGGDTVLMGSKMAKHYLKHSCIDPFIEDDDDGS